MSVKYFEKGYGLHRAIRTAGYKLVSNDNTQAADFLGRQSPSIDAAVQLIIDNYDPLPDVKAEARKRLKEHATILVLQVYPIYPDTADVRGIYNQLTDLYSGGLPLPPRLQQVKDIKDTFMTKRTEVNAMSDYRVIEAYDASIGW